MAQLGAARIGARCGWTACRRAVWTRVVSPAGWTCTYRQGHADVFVAEQLRQQILRLLVKEILVGNDTITIRHSLPITPSGSSGSGSGGINPTGSGMIGEPPKAGYFFAFGESSHHYYRTYTCITYSTNGQTNGGKKRGAT